MSVDIQQYDVVFTTDIATMGLLFSGSKLIKIDYLNKRPAKIVKNKHITAVKNKIEKFLESKSKLKNIKVDVQLDVSPFQEKVLQQLNRIPYGETRTYGDIAKTLKTSPRAVGNARIYDT